MALQSQAVILIDSDYTNSVSNSADYIFFFFFLQFYDSLFCWMIWTGVQLTRCPPVSTKNGDYKYKMIW